MIVPFKRLKASCLLGKAYKIRMVTVSMVFFSSVAHIKQCSAYCLNFKILFTVILVFFFPSFYDLKYTMYITVSVDVQAISFTYYVSAGFCR